MRNFKYLFLLLFSALLFCRPLSAQDLAAQCGARVEGRIQSVTGKLQTLEDHYLHYRWTEIKIRELVYDRLWKARRDAMDPFTQKTRDLGRDEEQRLLLVLSGLENDSIVHSNGFNEKLRAIQNSIGNWGKCCPEKAFLDLVYLAMTPRAPLEIPYKRDKRWRLNKEILRKYAKCFRYKPVEDFLKKNNLWD